MHEHRPSSSEYTDTANALCYRFPSFSFPPLNSPVITDINKCILYKTMYKFHSTLSLNRRRSLARALPFTFTPKYKIIVDSSSFFFSFFFKTRPDNLSQFAQDTNVVRPSVVIINVIGFTKRGTTRAIYI